MAKTNFISLCTLLLVVMILVCHHQVLPIEARHLKCKTKCRGKITSNSSNNIDHAHVPNSATNGQPLINKDQFTTTKAVDALDEFRSTSPGRSPGAGH